MASQTRLEGRYLGGRPPYGYTLADLGPHPNPGKAADGRRLHGLTPDPVTTPIVERIFTEYLAGRGLFAIAEGLTRDGILSPSANDPERNRHRSGIAWPKGAVRAILLNPRYTGYQIWNRQRTDEVLLDVDDVALGYINRMRWNKEEAWIRSTTPSHTALISEDTFHAAQDKIAAAGRAPKQRKPRSTPRVYQLRSLLHCGLCQRRMQGNQNHDQLYYRCRYPNEYGLANTVAHPRNAYLRENQIIPGLDAWLASIFRPDRIETTLDQLARAQQHPTPEPDPAIDAATGIIADCNAKLATYRQALEAGTNPDLVNAWIDEVVATRTQAEAQTKIKPVRTPTTRLSRDQIKYIVTTLTGLADVIAHADPRDKAEIYAKIGLTGRFIGLDGVME